MANRKKMIEEIMATFHAMRNKMHVTLMQSGHRDSITHSQLFVLAIIEKCHDIGIKEISKKLNISSSAATQRVSVALSMRPASCQLRTSGTSAASSS